MSLDVYLKSLGEFDPELFEAIGSSVAEAIKKHAAKERPKDNMTLAFVLLNTGLGLLATLDFNRMLEDSSTNEPSSEDILESEKLILRIALASYRKRMSEVALIGIESILKKGMN